MEEQKVAEAYGKAHADVAEERQKYVDLVTEARQSGIGRAHSLSIG